MSIGPRIAHRRQGKRRFVRDRPCQTKSALAVGGRLFYFFVWLVVRHALVDIHIGIVAVVVAVDPNRRCAVFVPMIMKSPCRADHHIATLHRIRLVFAYEYGILGRLADKSRFAAQVAVRLGALAGHEDLRIHPDGKLSGFDTDDGAHAGHAVGSDGDDLARTHETAVNAVPFPVRRGVALARHRASVTSQPGADEMMLGEKMLEVFMGGSYVDHRLTPMAAPNFPSRLERLKLLERLERFQ